ncbi:MAG: hypothetical protein EOL86_08490 [Deltaproteobacteria bacterium]|nr:hypothetical protein [Deltaproteobacteria bacterium]
MGGTLKNMSKDKRRAVMVPLTPAETRLWVRTYGRHARLYAWGFFMVVLPLMFGLIWWDLGEIDADALASFAFAAAVFFLLACWSRGVATQGWTGTVLEFSARPGSGSHDEGGPEDGSRLWIGTTGGKVRTVRLPEALRGYFSSGDRVFKLSGLDWPEKMILDRPKRVCLACGHLYVQGEGRCPRCRAPEPDHATLVRLAG